MTIINRTILQKDLFKEAAFPEMRKTLLAFLIPVSAALVFLIISFTQSAAFNLFAWIALGIVLTVCMLFYLFKRRMIIEEWTETLSRVYKKDKLEVNARIDEEKITMKTLGKTTIYLWKDLLKCMKTKNYYCLYFGGGGVVHLAKSGFTGNGAQQFADLIKSRKK